MAEGLEEIVQKILLEGDIEVIKQLSEIGEHGFETFHQLAEAAEQGASKMTIFATSLGLASAAFIGIAGAVGAFVHAQAEAIQETNLLARAFGTTTAQITAMEAAFASAGVSTSVFENFAQRLTQTVAREWPEIAASIRTASTEQAQAQEKVVASTIKVQEAQSNLGNVAAENGSKLAAANSRVETTFVALQFAARKAFQQMVQDANSVRGAQLGLVAAEQRLAELQGRPPSDAAKKELEISNAALAVDKARQAITDANLKQQQNRAEAATKAAKVQQDAADAQQKRELVLQEIVLSRQKAELQLKEAITQREQAEERASQQALKSIPKISTLVTNLIDGQKATGQAIDVTKVKIEDLAKGIIASASVAGKQPTGLEVTVQLSKLLSSEQGKLLDSAQRLAIVQQLGQQRMQQTGASASELLGVLSRGPAIYQKFEDAAKASFSTTDTAAHNVEHFRDAITELSFAIDLVNRSLAAAALPVFTHALEAIRESLTKNDGLLHAFVEGIKAIGSAAGTVIHWFEELFAASDKVFNLEKGRSFQIVIAAIVTVVAAFATAWLAVPAAIAVVVTAIGALAQNWDKLKQIASDAWTAIKDSTIGQFFSGLIDKAKELYEWLKKIGSALPGGKNSGKSPNSQDQAGGTQSAAEASAGTGFAGGGAIHGPGTSTSDSIPIRASDGEFMQSAEATSFWGVDFMNAINNLTFPGFASGGLVSPGPRPGSGQGPTPAMSVLNLAIDGRSFDGLRGPKNVVDGLASYAVNRQTSSAGKRPSWDS